MDEQTLSELRKERELTKSYLEALDVILGYKQQSIFDSPVSYESPPKAIGVAQSYQLPKTTADVQIIDFMRKKAKVPLLMGDLKEMFEKSGGLTGGIVNTIRKLKREGQFTAIMYGNSFSRTYWGLSTWLNAEGTDYLPEYRPAIIPLNMISAVTKEKEKEKEDSQIK